MSDCFIVADLYVLFEIACKLKYTSHMVVTERGNLQNLLDRWQEVDVCSICECS
jgi:hypothetical protein